MTFVGILLTSLPFIATCEHFMLGTYAMIILFTTGLLCGFNAYLHKDSLTLKTIDLVWGAWIGWCTLKFFILNDHVPDKGILFEGIGLCVWYTILRLNNHSTTIIIFCIASGTIQASIGILQYLEFINSNNIYFTFTGSFNNPGPLGGFLASTFLLS